MSLLSRADKRREDRDGDIQFPNRRERHSDLIGKCDNDLDKVGAGDEPVVRDDLVAEVQLNRRADATPGSEDHRMREVDLWLRSDTRCGGLLRRQPEQSTRLV